MRTSRLLSQAQRIVRDPRLRWAHDFQLWLELFVTVNLAFLAFDIYIAHSVNQFRHAAEYIPLYYSIAAPLALATVIYCAGSGTFRHPGEMSAISLDGSLY